MHDKSDTLHAYFPVNEEAIAIGLYITGVGTEHFGVNQPYPNPSHPDMYEFSWNIGRVLPEYQLVYIDKGEGEFESASAGKHKIHAGMVMMLMPDEWHRYRPNPKTGWLEYWVSFNGHLPHLWQQNGVVVPAHPVRSVIQRDALANAFHKIIQIARECPKEELTASFECLALLATMFTAITPRADVTATGNASNRWQLDDALAGEALDLIWNYSHRSLSVGGIAKSLGVTRRTLERRFRSARKRTVIEELTACRLSRAQRLLRETHLSVKQIASLTGFSSPDYLATVFRKKLNMPPRGYRHRQRKQAS